MWSTTAALLLALAVLFVLLLARHAAVVVGPAAAVIGPAAARAERYCAGPENLNLYDSPRKGYPFYEGRAAARWDVDRRCMATCQQSPCVVWCR